MSFSREAFPDPTMSRFPLLTFVLQHCILLVSCTSNYVYLFVYWVFISNPIVSSEVREHNCVSSDMSQVPRTVLLTN